ncbi:MLO-like protein [Psidium guajava]|nr:MLO-like protein [Psidium guajava]
MENKSGSLAYTPTWIVAGVCFIIVFLSLCAERALHRLGKFLKRKKQDALFEALQKLKEELMLLGFISFLLTVFQRILSQICIPPHLASHMRPCKERVSEIATHGELLLQTTNNRRRLLSTDPSVENCAHKGQVPLLSIEALHELHIFVFVLAVVHVIFCATTMVLGGVKIRQWKNWENSLRRDTPKKGKTHASSTDGDDRDADFRQRASGLEESSYCELDDFVYETILWLRHQIRLCRSATWIYYAPLPFNSQHRLVFLAIRRPVLLLNVEGWNTYLDVVSTISPFAPCWSKLEHIITRLAQEVESRRDPEAPQVKPSDEHFWFDCLFLWIWSTYGIHSCMMERIGFIIPRLIMGVLVQVLCSYSTLPLYALVSQMGSGFKEGMFNYPVLLPLWRWAEGRKKRGQSIPQNDSSGGATASHSHRTVAQSSENLGHR